MRMVDDKENREVIMKGTGDLITVDWDEYSNRVYVRCAEYQSLALTEVEAIDTARAILRTVENYKRKELDDQFRH